ncbi:hypothetical protein Nit79A3_1429 [Nitrosomonas sp. Is79A3]|uniref:hypothetical protein n=1 Tax=Nitrosomonas sp. (strain Is79A3) TaxID=261292 RepID=UPI000215CFF6
MYIPNYIGKSPDEIIGIDLFDSASYLYRSMAWLDYHKRTKKFSSLLYACAEGRNGIEYLLFEELVISTGANLSVEKYKKCVNEKNLFKRTIAQLSPDYELLQIFSQIILSLEPSAPKLIYWDHSSLMKAWGVLSRYLHWSGARNLTSENAVWLDSARLAVHDVLEPIWLKITSGQSGLMHPNNMVPIVHEIWERFRSGEIDASAAKFQLKFLEPVVP